MPEPKPGVDDPNKEGVDAGVDPKTGVVLEPKGEEPNVEVVVPKPEGFEANGFACTDVEKGFDDVCPNAGVEKGLDCVGVCVGAGVDMPKFIPGVD